MTQQNKIHIAVVCAIDLSVKSLLKPQIEAMTEAGYDVIVICSDGAVVPELRAQGLNIVTTPILRKISPWRHVARRVTDILISSECINE